MPPNKMLDSTATTLSFEKFWGWLQAHPNCILRAGTPETVLYDDEKLHWHFAAEGPDTVVVQVMRAKRILGEIAVIPSEVAYVQGEAGEGDEYVFELMSESDSERVAAYHFVLSHGYDAEEPVSGGGRAVH
jgi:hypothetical protein